MQTTPGQFLTLSTEVSRL